MKKYLRRQSCLAPDATGNVGINCGAVQPLLASAGHSLCSANNGAARYASAENEAEKVDHCLTVRHAGEL